MRSKIHPRQVPIPSGPPSHTCRHTARRFRKRVRQGAGPGIPESPHHFGCDDLMRHHQIMTYSGAFLFQESVLESVARQLPDFDELFHASQIAKRLRRDLDVRGNALIEDRVQLVGVLCPDASAASLG